MNQQTLQNDPLRGSGLIVDWNDDASSSGIEREEVMCVARQSGPLDRVITRRSVSFDSNSKCLRIRGLWQITVEEKDSAWYSREDLVEMRKEMKETVKFMRKSRSTNLPDPRYCTRGLEHLRTSALLRSRQEELHRLVDAVFTAQDRQRKIGYTDPLAIALVSNIRTTEARDRAILAGERDAAETEVDVEVEALVGPSLRDEPERPRRRRPDLSTLESALEASIEEGGQNLASSLPAKRHAGLIRAQHANSFTSPRTPETPT